MAKCNQLTPLPFKGLINSPWALKIRWSENACSYPFWVLLERFWRVQRGQIDL